MKKAPSVSLFNDLYETEFDVVLLGSNLPGSFLAYSLAASGKKVALICSGDFTRNDDFRFTRIFPKSMKAITHVRSRLELASRLQHKTPHLFLQQRMLWLRNSAVSNKLLTQAYNQLAVRHHSERAGNLKTGSYPEYAFFHDRGFSHGILCREYRYNHSRMVMEWLKAASREGAFISNYTSVVGREGISLKLLDELTQQDHMVRARQVIHLVPATQMFSCKVSFPENSWNNPVRVSGESAEFILSREDGEVGAIAFADVSHGEEFHVWNEFRNLFALPEDEDIMKTREMMVPNVPLIEVDMEIVDFPVEDMEEELSALFPEFTEWQIPDIWFSNEDNRHISQLFEMAQRKFYEAKQTGIDEAWFMELFYRYGPAIDELTEGAYQRMNETRDPFQLWSKSIRAYEEENEWRRQ